MRKYSKLIKQLIFFGLVGGISFLIDLAVTITTYNVLHFPPYLAGSVGSLSAFFFNFPINRKHVFNHTNYDRFSMRTQIVLYGSLSVFNLLMTGLLMELAIDSGLLNVGLAKACITGLIAVWNFMIFRFYIFSKRPDQGELESLIVQ